MIDIVSLIQSRGVKLTKQGSVYVGACPFHENASDDSLVVDAKESSFLCEHCDLIGDTVIVLMQNLQQQLGTREI